ncbi:histidinol-phosphatase [bacterium]|nr:histidinol-phosphatase [bacterium]
MILRSSHRIFILFLVGIVLVGASAQVRQEIVIPDINGYITLKCDFHVHSVFSDGLVWPSVRIDEAWREGLDAIAITEHLEYQNDEVKGDHNRAWEIANERAKRYGMICIQGTEITKDMPPGHFNALFIDDANPAHSDTFMVAIEAVAKQNAFIMFNHPGWKGQQPDGVSRWYDIHTTLLEKGWLHGIEVVNEREYYPAVQTWCMEKNLTMLGNSDIHQPIHMFFKLGNGGHRPMTLVFAKEQTEAAIKEALFDRRTAVWHQDMLIGQEIFLRPIFEAMTSFDAIQDTIKEEKWASLSLRNTSDIPLKLEAAGEIPELKIPAKITVPARSIVLVRVKAKENVALGTHQVSLPYIVENFRISADQGLSIVLETELIFIEGE